MSEKKRPNPGSAIAVGAGLGAAFGLLLDNLALGVAIGLTLGVASGGVSQMRKRGEAQRDDDDDTGPRPGA